MSEKTEIMRCPCGAACNTEEGPYPFGFSGKLFTLTCEDGDCGWSIVADTAEQCIAEWNRRVTQANGSDTELNELRAELGSIADMVTMLSNGEWAEHAGKGWHSRAVESAITKLVNEVHETKAERDALQAELATVREPSPIGYIRKADLARLQEEVMWDGSYLNIGVNRWAQLTEDTPYDHLAPIYALPVTADVVQVPRELRELLQSCADYMEGSKSAQVRVWHGKLLAMLATSQKVK